MDWGKIFKKRKIIESICTVVSDKGSVRNNNEDNFFCDGFYNIESDNQYSTRHKIKWNGWKVVAVFDGMGGIEHGEVASKIVAESFAEYGEQIRNVDNVELLDDMACLIFLEANRRIVNETSNAGTTASVLIMNGNVAKVYHLGDSRVYLIRNDNMIQLTKDQTLENFKIELGLESQIEKGDRHKIMEYVGCDPDSVELQPYMSELVTLQAGDHFLLCSDGVYDVCSDEQLLELVQNPDNVNVAQAVVDFSIQNGSRDNMTCIHLVC